MSTAGTLPDIAEVLAPLLERIAPEQQPLLIAIAERMAASRYRVWARGVASPTRRAALLGCAEREEEIAARIESLFADAAAIQADIRRQNPDLDEINRTLFADRPVEDQYRIQAAGERVGAATWRALAKRAEPVARPVLRECADLEEQSAAVLESILAEGS